MSASNAPNPANPAPPPVDVNDPDHPLQKFLNLINGQDAYDAKTVAVGKLSRTHHLFVPHGFAPTNTPPDVIGRANATPTMDHTIFAQIYAMNKPVFDTPEQQIRGAFLRASMVRYGWYTGTYEVTQATPPNNAVDIMAADLDEIEQIADDARTLAILLPLIAEFVFRTMGHHYLTAMQADYVEKYQAVFTACVVPRLTEYLPPGILYHRVAHWVSLSTALDVVSNETQALRLPNALVARKDAAPAGTAIIATSNAILETLEGTGLGKSLATASGVDVARIKAKTAEIKSDVANFHTIPSAYGRQLLAPNDADDLEDVKAEAKKLAPVLQGFLDSLPRNSDLSRAKALAKHADVNPLLRKRAKAFFREVGTSKAADVGELFAMNKRATEATGGAEVLDEDEIEGDY